MGRRAAIVMLWHDENITVERGGTVTFKNRTTDGHTMALVTAVALPKTTADVTNCEQGNGTICDAVNGAPDIGAHEAGTPPMVFGVKAEFVPPAMPAPGDSRLVLGIEAGLGRGHTRQRVWQPELALVEQVLLDQAPHHVPIE